MRLHASVLCDALVKWFFDNFSMFADSFSVLYIHCVARGLRASLLYKVPRIAPQFLATARLSCYIQYNEAYFRCTKCNKPVHGGSSTDFLCSVRPYITLKPVGELRTKLLCGCFYRAAKRPDFAETVTESA